MSSGSKKTTVGYWYRLLYHFGLVKGPVDAFLEFRAGDRTAWKGQLTESGRITVNAANLWGGEKSEGGLSGELDIMMGESTQGPNDYLAAELGVDQPSYRGKLSAVWRGGRWGAMNPYPKPAAFKVRRILKGWDNDVCWYPEKAEIILDQYVPEFSLSLTKTSDNAWIFTAPSEVSGWSYNPDDYLTESVGIGSSINWPSGAGATGLAWLHIHAPGGVPREFSLDVKVNYDDSGKVIGTYGVTIGPATTPPVVVGFPRSEGIRVVVPAASGPFYGYVAFACVDARNIDTGASLGTTSNHRMLVSSATVIANLVGMNPGHIIYDSLTAADMQGEPVGMINEASFRASADILYSEGFGLCMEYDGGPIDEFQQRICDIIGGSLTQSRVDGEYYLDLIRGDYELGSLPIISADDIVEFSHEPSVLTEQPNQVIVEWFDPETKSDCSTAPMQVMGAIQAAGRVIPETRSYPEIATEGLALRVGGRDLQALSKPTGRYRLTINRRSFDLRPSRQFCLQYPAEGIVDMVCVLGDIDTGTLTDGRIKIIAVQDVYGFPATVYVASEPGLSVPPSPFPVPSPHQLLLEAPYLELVANMSRADLEALPADAGVLMTLATRAQNGLNYSIYSAAEGEDYADNGSGDWCPTALIIEPAGYSETEFTLSAGVDLGEVELGTWALWGSEIVRIDTLDVEGGTLTLGRGCADTVPAPHAAGSRIFFCGDWGGTDGREYVDGDTVRAKLLTRTTVAEQDLIGATEHTIEMSQRQFRPYPPGRLLLNGESWPDLVTGNLVVSFSHRDRLLQADKLFDATVADIGPEPGTTYDLEIWDRSDNLLVYSATDISTPMTVPSANMPFQSRLLVYAVRAGLRSIQGASADFEHGRQLWAPGNLIVHPVIWLDDSTAVNDVSGAASQWDDRSGNDFHFSSSAAANRPLIIADGVGGRRILRFDGSNDAMVSASLAARSIFSGVSGAWSFAVVSKRALDASPTSRMVFRASAGGSGGLERYSMRVGYTGTGNANKLYAAVRRLDSDSFSVLAAPAAVDTGYHMIAQFHDYSTGICRLYQDGIQVASATITSAGVTSSTAGTQALSIGGHPETAIHNSDIDLAALLVGAGSLPSDSDVDRLFGWAAWRYGLVDLLPIDHPYKSEEPFV